MSKSISASLPIYFRPFFSLSFFHFLFLYTIFLFSTLFFLFFSLFCHLFLSDPILCPTPGPSREGPEGPPVTSLPELLLEKSGHRQWLNQRGRATHWYWPILPSMTPSRDRCAPAGKTRPYTRHMSLLEGRKAKAWPKALRTDGPTDGPTDGRTHALIESLRRD